MGKKGSSTTSSTVKVPEYLDKELQYGLGQARNLYNKGAPKFFSGQTYANFNPLQTEALDATAARARDGSPLIDASQDLTQRTINGEFLNNNPYLDQLLERYGAKANQQVLGSFNASGRMGSGANTQTAIQAVSDATLPYLFENYQNERGLQTQASQFAPSLAATDYQDLAALSGVGDVYQEQDQRGIDEAMARYNYDANAPSAWLDQYMSRVNGSGANNLTTQTQTTKQKAGLGSVLGTALSIGTMFTGERPFAGVFNGMGSSRGLSSGARAMGGY
jgi:hypothetical protein